MKSAKTHLSDDKRHKVRQNALQLRMDTWVWNSPLMLKPLWPLQTRSVPRIPALAVDEWPVECFLVVVYVAESNHGISPASWLEWDIVNDFMDKTLLHDTRVLYDERSFWMILIALLVVFRTKWFNHSLSLPVISYLFLASVTTEGHQSISNTPAMFDNVKLYVLFSSINELTSWMHRVSSQIGMYRILHDIPLLVQDPQAR